MTDPPMPATSQPSRWYHSMWFVLVMLFFVLGPLALPLLWKSPRFPRWSKWCLTILCVGSLVWITLKVVEIARGIVGQYQQLY